MLEAIDHPILTPLMRLYIDRRLRRSFHQIHCDGNETPRSDAPLLVLANHVGWWDGFWIEQLMRRQFHRNLRVLMNYDSLSKNKLLRYMGGFAASEGVHQQQQLVTYMLAQLERETHALLLFPQGALSSLYQSQIHFQRGASYLIEKSKERPEILFIALLVEYGSEPRPSVYLEYETYKGADCSTHGLQQAYEAFLDGRLQIHKQQMEGL